MNIAQIFENKFKTEVGEQHWNKKGAQFLLQVVQSRISQCGDQLNLDMLKKEINGKKIYHGTITQACRALDQVFNSRVNQRPTLPVNPDLMAKLNPKEKDLINLVIEGGTYNRQAVQDLKKYLEGYIPTQNRTWQQRKEQRGKTFERRQKFVPILEQLQGEVGQKIRNELCSLFYRKHLDTSAGYIEVSAKARDKKVEWVNPNEVSSSFKRAMYFHGTSTLENLKGILQSGKVEVNDGVVARGAFVSVNPEIDYGPCWIAFNRSIERVGELRNGFTPIQSDGTRVGDFNVYWAGFSKAIPVIPETAEFILIEKEENRSTVEALSNLKVYIRQEYQDKYPVEERELHVPAEWRKSTQIL